MKIGSEYIVPDQYDKDVNINKVCSYASFANMYGICVAWIVDLPPLLSSVWLSTTPTPPPPFFGVYVM